MTTRAIAALTALLFASVATAGNFTQNNTDKAKALIDAAIEAHGGDALLSGLETMIVRQRSINHAVGQSLGTEPPWDTSEGTGYDAIDLANSVYVNRNISSGGGFQNDGGTIINGDDSYQLNYRSGTVATIAEPDFQTASGPFVRVTPALLLRTLNDRRANAHYLGETEVDGVVYKVIGFSMTVGPAISLYFDKDTNRLHYSERVFPGFGLVEYIFDDYETVDGIAVNNTFTLRLNGDINLEREILAVEINEPLDSLLEIDETLVSIPPVSPDPLSRQEIDEGVWLIGGNGTYAMFVDMGDYIFAAGGTAGIPDRIASLREVIGDKEIRYGMMSHHHFDHVLGVPDYEAEGAALIAATEHERVVRNAAADGESLKIKTVDGRMTLKGDRRVDIIDIGPTAHSEHLLVAYLPNEQILFEADHFGLPQSGPVPPAGDATRSFARALQRLELDVEKILSAHSPRIATPDDLETALGKEVRQAQARN
jgi:glyoxylase-like metal-dependent hydrolase (beta-lactamase superfamily II)